MVQYNIAVRNSNVFDVRNAVLDYASRVFGLLRESLVDINVFVLLSYTSGW